MNGMGHHTFAKAESQFKKLMHTKSIAVSVLKQLIISFMVMDALAKPAKSRDHYVN